MDIGLISVSIYFNFKMVDLLVIQLHVKLFCFIVLIIPMATIQCFGCSDGNGGDGGEGDRGRRPSRGRVDTQSGQGVPSSTKYFKNHSNIQPIRWLKGYIHCHS